MAESVQSDRKINYDVIRSATNQTPRRQDYSKIFGSIEVDT
jgi:hypothetical protein